MASKLGDGAELRVGFLEGADYPGTAVKNREGKMVKTSTVSVATVAASNEFGNGRAPPRPFFRNMIAEKKAEWAPGVATQFKLNNYDVEKTLNVVGEAIKGQLQQSIIDTNTPPLSPITIERKGFDKPLIDTSIMLNSVDYEVNLRGN